MTTTKKNEKIVIKRRSVSKPRLLKELLSTLDAREIQDSRPISDLITAIEQDIITEAMAE